MDEAKKKGWVVISMKNDWKTTLFSFIRYNYKVTTIKN